MNNKQTDEENIETQNEVNSNSQEHSVVIIEKTIGDYLKSVREEKKLSIKVVASHTKISVTNLELLEENRFDALPNIAYLKGFVRNYAKILGLNPQSAVEVLIKTYGKDEEEFVMPQPEQDISVESPNPLEEETKRDTSNKFVAVAGVIVAAVLLSFYLFNSSPSKVTDTNKSEEIEVQTQSEEVVAQVANSDNDVVEAKEVAAAVPQEEKIEELKENLIKAEEEKKEEVVAVQEEKESVKKEETKVAENKKEEKEEEKLVLRPIPTPLFAFSNESEENIDQWLPSNFKNAVVSGKQNIFINAIEGSSWITYKTDEDAVKKFVLEQGKMLMIRGDEVRVFLGNVHATKIFLNNKLLEITSKSGVKSLVFPEENASKFRLPLFIFNKDGSVSGSDSLEQEN